MRPFMPLLLAFHLLLCGQGAAQITVLTLCTPVPTPLQGDTAVYDSADVDLQPMLAEIPERDTLRLGGVPGYSPFTVGAQFSLIVDRAGDVEPGSVTLIATSDTLLATQIAQVLASSRFCPGLKSGVPVRVRIRFRYSIIRAERGS